MLDTFGNKKNAKLTSSSLVRSGVCYARTIVLFNPWSLSGSNIIRCSRFPWETYMIGPTVECPDMPRFFDRYLYIFAAFIFAREMRFRKTNCWNQTWNYSCERFLLRDTNRYQEVSKNKSCGLSLKLIPSLSSLYPGHSSGKRPVMAYWQSASTNGTGNGTGHDTSSKACPKKCHKKAHVI